MSRTITIAPAGVGFALGALTFITFGATFVGAMVAIAAEKVERAQGGSASDYRIGGVVVAALAGAGLSWALRRWGAVRRLEESDGAWTAVTFLGRRRALAKGPIALELYGRRVVWSFGAAPRLQDLVDGTLVASNGRFRLAPSGPVTYDAVLKQLGVSAAAPRRGRETFTIA